MTNIHTLDLRFLGLEKVVGAYLLQHKDANILIECGSSSMLPELQKELQRFGLDLQDITHVLPTHVHFDHAGASGHFAQNGAQIYIHHVGHPHLLDPSKLWNSASRIYGEDAMEALWGKLLPIPASQCTALQDGDVIDIAGLSILCLDTPGHANHHMSFVVDSNCFSGDVGGATIPGTRKIRIPSPPPEFDLELWLQSIEKIRSHRLDRIYLTHFGGYDRVDPFLQEVQKQLLLASDFVRNCMQEGMDVEKIIQEYGIWFEKLLVKEGLSNEEINSYRSVAADAGNVRGIHRYFQKKTGS